MENKIAELLCDWGICDKKSIETFYPKVRDRDDISVMRCKKSGVIFTSTSEHMSLSHYTKKNNLDYWKAENRKKALLDSLTDDERRKKQFQSLIKNKKWLDIGSGLGGTLDLLSPFAKKIVAVEPQPKALKLLKKEKYDAYQDISKVPFNNFDVITLFHVFEHLTEPLETLKLTYSKLQPGGKIIIEVPHASDFLFSFLDCEEFKKFTFWSEHLILHTKDSLKVFLKKAGFKNITITGFQRYPLANHLYWLKEKKPGGHIKWSILKNDELDNAYSNSLKKLNMTDTLIAIAKK